ncbi:hypothetical protein [Pseudomonas sp. BN515]|uniref:hypothetical protein n=1 Tax=Pseudomonas sp. BN515 TaxID=2567892 RepID=UPI002458D64E|nr:hypothetical protein [Pseudomonas sp. BN515]MDH4869818.1 hypothetical protein [Pseudomonas sp. BN515]
MAGRGNTRAASTDTPSTAAPKTTAAQATEDQVAGANATDAQPGNQVNAAGQAGSPPAAGDPDARATSDQSMKTQVSGDSAGGASPAAGNDVGRVAMPSEESDGTSASNPIARMYRVVGIDLDIDGERVDEGETIELEGEPSAKLARHLERIDQ